MIFFYCNRKYERLFIFHKNPVTNDRTTRFEFSIASADSLLTEGKIGWKLGVSMYLFLFGFRVPHFRGCRTLQWKKTKWEKKPFTTLERHFFIFFSGPRKKNKVGMKRWWKEWFAQKKRKENGSEQTTLLIENKWLNVLVVPSLSFSKRFIF